MDLEIILNFLSQKKYGAYELLVRYYQIQIKELKIKMAFDYINLDLQDTLIKKNISLNYNSFKPQFRKYVFTKQIRSKKIEGKIKEDVQKFELPFELKVDNPNSNYYSYGPEPRKFFKDFEKRKDQIEKNSLRNSTNS